MFGHGAIGSRPRRRRLPDLDDHLVEPGTRYEMLDGELIYVPPARYHHARRHSKLAALAEAHVGPEFQVACDMLTRVSKTSDVAPDVSVLPLALDPRTGKRQLEHLSFEVVSTGSLAYTGRKAARLVARGVRRVFAIESPGSAGARSTAKRCGGSIDLRRKRVLEWSGPLETWSPLELGGRIEDPTFAVPLPLPPLLDTARADDVIARALLAKQNPVLEADRARAVSRGKAEALLVVLTVRGFALDDRARARILDEHDPERLDRWIARATKVKHLAELLAEP